METEIKKFSRLFILNYAIIFSCGLIVLLIINRLNITLGYILAGIVTIICYLIHAYHASLIGNNRASGFLRFITSYPIRMLIEALCLFVAYKWGNLFNFMTCAIVLIAYNFFFLIYSFIYSHKENKQKEEDMSERSEEKENEC